MKETLLITGANGFLGRGLVRNFKNSPFNVLTTDLWGDGLDKKGDLLDRDFVKSLFEGANVKYVIHAAALVPLVNDEEGFKNSNVDASRNLAEEARKNGAKYFLYVSSSAPYGRPRDFPINKDTPLDPIEPYGKSKAEAESAILECLESYVKTCIVRPRTILGQNRFGIFEILFRWICKGYIIPLADGGSHSLQLVHIEDVVSLIRHLVFEEISGVWPAGAPSYETLRIDLEVAIKRHQRAIRIIDVPPSLFKFLGFLLAKLRLSPFTAWHYGTMDVNFAFEDYWKPRGFEYSRSNQDCIYEAFDAYLKSSESIGDSAHTRSWPTRTLDFGLSILTSVLRGKKND